MNRLGRLAGAIEIVEWVSRPPVHRLARWRRCVFYMIDYVNAQGARSRAKAGECFRRNIGGAHARSIYNWRGGQARPPAQHLREIFALKTFARRRAKESSRAAKRTRQRALNARDFPRHESLLCNARRWAAAGGRASGVKAPAEPRRPKPRRYAGARNAFRSSPHWCRRSGPQ